MLPLKDTIRSRTFPIVTWIIIAVNALAFLFELSLSQADLQRLMLTFGLVPAQVSWVQPETWLPFLTHIFLHGGWLHILSNMWTLVIFGDNVEDRLGSVRYTIFYLLSGLAAGGLQYAIDPTSPVPAIGASGAIAGVLGAYMLFYPRSRVLTFIPVFFLPWLVEVPAVIYLGFWFVSQLFSGLLSLLPANMSAGGIAWWAHIGGFLFGLLAARLVGPPKQQPRWYPDQYYPW